MAVSLPITIADAPRWIRSHPAAARGVIEVAAGAGRQDLAVVGLREPGKDSAEVLVGMGLPRASGGVEPVLDLRQRVAPAVARVVVERERAVAIGMYVVVTAHARRPARRPPPPVSQQIVAEQDLAFTVPQTGLPAGGPFPNPQIVAAKCWIRP